MVHGFILYTLAAFLMVTICVAAKGFPYNTHVWLKYLAVGLLWPAVSAVCLVEVLREVVSKEA